MAAMASGNAKAKAYETFAELAKDHWTPSKPEDVELVFEALGKKAEEPPVEMEAEQWTALGEVFQKGNFAQVHSVVSDLGKTMEGMMSALNSGDDAAVEDVLRKSGALQHMTDGDFNDLKSQMEEFEDEFKEMGLE